MTEEQRKLAWGLVILPSGKRAIAPGDFRKRFPSAIVGDRLASSLLEAATKERSNADLCATLIIGATFGFSDEHTDLLVHLLGAEWHTSHEDIVSTLQKTGDSRAVDALYATALTTYDYLAYDECYGLARKCTWALADIGTPAARAKLAMLSQSENELIASYAQERLDSWEIECERKRA